MKSNIKELLNDATNIGDEILKKDPINILFQEKVIYLISRFLK